MSKTIKLFSLLLITAFAAGPMSCTREKISGLGALPKADFVIVPGPDANTIILVNKTASATMPYWKVGTSPVKLAGDSVSKNFVFAGTYPVTLYVAGQGGIDSVTKQVTITQNDPTACAGQIGNIAGCTQKTWKMNPASAAWAVGPNPGDGSWWHNDGDPATLSGPRSCEFNDEYTFVFDANGTFTYDNKGDFYSDGYLGNTPGYTCQLSSEYPASQAKWGSGSFNYTFTPNAGVNKLGQLTVVGAGAHIGLQDVINGSSPHVVTATSVTYDVISFTHDPAGFDIMALAINFGGGWWTFTLRSY